MEKNNTMIVNHQMGGFNSAVDIVIPYHGQYEKLTKLLESIFKYTRSNEYRVCVVDDNSENQYFFNSMNENAKRHSASKGIQNVFQAVRLEEQLGFAGAIKAGFNATNSPYVCFINSDCRVEDSNWLRAMGECLIKLKPEGVRMIAPMTNNIVGGHEAQYGEKLNRNQEHYILAPDEYLSLYCVMCHRDLFQHCGGFFKLYPFGFYEDQEFASRMNRHGFKQAVCRTSWIYHEGAATISTLWRNNPKTKQIMYEENKNRCIEDMKNPKQ